MVPLEVELWVTIFYHFKTVPMEYECIPPRLKPQPPPPPLTGTDVAPVLYNLIKLSPGPLQHCAGDFWQMVWEQGVSEVIMLATADNEDVSTLINFGNAILGVPDASKYFYIFT